MTRPGNPQLPIEPSVRVAAGAAEERRLTDLFCALASIPSPSGSERACGEAVVAELDALGVEVVADNAGAEVGGDFGNLYCAIPPSTPGTPIFLCAHLDTIPPSAPLEPVLVEGMLRNATPSIVGADNKAAVVVLLEAIRDLVESGEPHAGVELVFTVGEEQGLRGARAFDSSRIHARSGFVLDHPGAIGGYVAQAPSRRILRATVHGRDAHAGIAPEDGLNAISALSKAIAGFPRSEPDTSINVGLIRGGSALNVVAGRAEAGIEVRSTRNESADEAVELLITTLRETCKQEGCTVELEVDRAYSAYQVPGDSTALRLASLAFTKLGRPVTALETRGGSDANVLRARGLDCINLAHAVVDLHGPEERVAVSDLVLMKRVLLEIVSAAVEPKVAHQTSH